MKNLILFCSLLLIVSCSPTLTEVWIRDVDSSRIEVTMDMGESINMVGSMLNEMKESEDGEESSESFNMYESEKKMDTTLNFFSVMPDSVRRKLTDPQALEIMNIDLHVDPEKEIGMLKLNMDYKSEEELERFYTALIEMESLDKTKSLSQAGQGDTKQMLNDMLGGHKLDYENKVVRIPRTDPMKELKDNGMYNELAPKIDSLQYLEEGSFERQMIEMLIPGETKTRVHVPGKILFTSDPNAVIDGNTVTFTMNVMQIMIDGGEIPTSDIIIKFK